MLDRQTEELAIQYVLDELSSRDRLRFGRQISGNEELRAYVRNLEGALARYAVISTRQQKAPLAVLAAAKAQTRMIESPRRHRAWIRQSSVVAAMAAICAVAGFFFGRGAFQPSEQTEHGTSGLESRHVAHGRASTPQSVELRETVERLRQRVLYLEHQSQQASQKELVLREALHELLRRSPGSLRSEEFLARLEDALELPPGSLDATVAALLQSLARTSNGPGVAQVTVMELSPPGGVQEPSLAPVASTIISEAFWKVVQDSQGLVAAYDDNSNPEDMPLNLRDGGAVSPTSLNRGREGGFAPPFPGAVGQTEAVPDRTEAVDLAEGALEAPAGPNIPALTEQVVSDIEQVVEPRSPVGFAVWDQGSRAGSLSLRDVPALGQSETYQLWGEDSVTGEPFSIGLLPPITDGTGRVFFELSDGDPTPSRLFVTTEPDGGSSRPGGHIVLESPTGATAEPVQ